MRLALGIVTLFSLLAGRATPDDKAEDVYVEDSMLVGEFSANQSYLFEVIKTRRTVRKFKDTPVPEAHILAILDAARFAPTAGNQQPWKFLVIRDRGKLDSLGSEATDWYLETAAENQEIDHKEMETMRVSLSGMMESVLSAPVYVAVLVNTKTDYPQYVVHDGTLAAGYLMIAARALGYGTGFFTTFFPSRKMKEFFNIPNDYELICFTPIGVPAQWPVTPSKKALREVVVFESFEE